MPPFVRESLLQEKKENKVRCNVCERRCVLVTDGSGWCRTRENRGGKLMTLIYGALRSHRWRSTRVRIHCATHADPDAGARPAGR